MAGMTLRKAAGPAAAIALFALLTGCGYTARDEYMDRHQGAIQPQRGDGSTLAARREDPFRAQSGRVTAKAADGLDR